MRLFEVYLIYIALCIYDITYNTFEWIGGCRTLKMFYCGLKIILCPVFGVNKIPFHCLGKNATSSPIIQRGSIYQMIYHLKKMFWTYLNSHDIFQYASYSLTFGLIICFNCCVQDTKWMIRSVYVILSTYLCGAIMHLITTVT